MPSATLISITLQNQTRVCSRSSAPITLSSVFSKVPEKYTPHLSPTSISHGAIAIEGPTYLQFYDEPQFLAAVDYASRNGKAVSKVVVALEMDQDVWREIAEQDKRAWELEKERTRGVYKDCLGRMGKGAARVRRVKA